MPSWSPATVKGTESRTLPLGPGPGLAVVVTGGGPAPSPGLAALRPALAGGPEGAACASLVARSAVRTYYWSRPPAEEHFRGIGNNGPLRANAGPLPARPVIGLTRFLVVTVVTRIVLKKNCVSCCVSASCNGPATVLRPEDFADLNHLIMEFMVQRPN